MPHVILLKDRPHHLTKYLEMQSKLNQKSQFPISLWIENSLEIYTAPDQHFEIQMLNLWMSWENLRPNLTFTVENKMGFHIKEDGHISNLT